MTAVEAKKYFEDNHYEFDSEEAEESFCKLAADFAKHKLEQAEKEKQELVDMITEHYELSKKDMGEDYRVSMPKALYDYAKNSNK